MLHIFEEEFYFTKGEYTVTPVDPGSTLRKATSEYTPVSKEIIKYFI